MLVNNNDDHDNQKYNNDYDYQKHNNTNKRWEQYQDLSELGRSLMDLLYSGSDNYLKAIGYNSVKNDIEKHIIAYDQNLDHEGASAARATRKWPPRPQAGCDLGALRSPRSAAEI